jgi:hypothetical protein
MSHWIDEDDLFEVIVRAPEQADITDRTRRETAPVTRGGVVAGAATARLHGFDLDERPLVIGLPDLPHQIVSARTTVSLLRRDTGATVVVLFEDGDLRRPIIVGVVQDSRSALPATPAPVVSAQVDDQKVVLTAEREIVLKCGEASITLTRAGKVLIKGTYVLSRSSGYNKIKGAAVDIN